MLVPVLHRLGELCVGALSALLPEPCEFRSLTTATSMRESILNIMSLVDLQKQTNVQTRNRYLLVRAPDYNCAY